MAGVGGGQEGGVWTVGAIRRIVQRYNILVSPLQEALRPFLTTLKSQEPLLTKLATKFLAIYTVRSIGMK